VPGYITSASIRNGQFWPALPDVTLLGLVLVMSHRPPWRGTGSGREPFIAGRAAVTVSAALKWWFGAGVIDGSNGADDGSAELLRWQ
jgi:hypothetical protein